MKHLAKFKKLFVIISCLFIINIHPAAYNIKPAKAQSQFRAKLQQQAAAQTAAAVSLSQQVYDVKQQIIQKQAQLDAEKRTCNQVSPYEQAFAESCLNVEIFTQELEDLTNLLNSLHQQQMQEYEASKNQ